MSRLRSPPIMAPATNVDGLQGPPYSFSIDVALNECSTLKVWNEIKTV